MAVKRVIHKKTVKKNKTKPSNTQINKQKSQMTEPTNGSNNNNNNNNACISASQVNGTPVAATNPSISLSLSPNEHHEPKLWGVSSDSELLDGSIFVGGNLMRRIVPASNIPGSLDPLAPDQRCSVISISSNSDVSVGSVYSLLPTPNENTKTDTTIAAKAKMPALPEENGKTMRNPEPEQQTDNSVTKLPIRPNVRFSQEPSTSAAAAEARRMEKLNEERLKLKKLRANTQAVLSSSSSTDSSTGSSTQTTNFKNYIPSLTLILNMKEIKCQTIAEALSQHPLVGEGKYRALTQKGNGTVRFIFVNSTTLDAAKKMLLEMGVKIFHPPMVRSQNSGASELYEDSENRPSLRVRILDIMPSTTLDEVRRQLDIYRVKYRAIRQMQHFRTKEPLGTFELDIDPLHKFSCIKLLEEKTISGQIATIHLLPAIPDPKPCFKCQGYLHTQIKCRNEVTCYKCSGNHYSRNCTKPPNLPGRCANCGGEHISRFKGCPAYKEARRRMMKRQRKDRININQMENSQKYNRRRSPDSRKYHIRTRDDKSKPGTSNNHNQNKHRLDRQQFTKLDRQYTQSKGSRATNYGQETGRVNNKLGPNKEKPNVNDRKKPLVDYLGKIRPIPIGPRSAKRTRSQQKESSGIVGGIRKRTKEAENTKRVKKTKSTDANDVAVSAKRSKTPNAKTLSGYISSSSSQNSVGDDSLSQPIIIDTVYR